MPRRVLPAVLALAYAALAGHGAEVLAKDDAAEKSAARDAIRKEYAEQKKYPTADLSYVVDSKKLADPRWAPKTLPDPADPDQGRMFTADFPSGNPTDPSVSITVEVVKCIHSKTVGGNTTVFSHTFDALGTQVKVSDVKEMARGFYDEFLKNSAEPVTTQCQEPGERGAVGPAKYWGCAVATDKVLKRRVRKDWYLWVQHDKKGSFTWWAVFTTSDKYLDNKAWLAHIPDLMKNFRELDDPRLK